MSDQLLLDLTVAEFISIATKLLDHRKPTDPLAALMKKLEDLAVQFSLLRERMTQDTEPKLTAQDQVATFDEITIPILDTVDDMLEFSSSQKRDEARRLTQIEYLLRELERSFTEETRPSAVAEILRRLKRDQALEVVVDFNQILVIITRLALAAACPDKGAVIQDSTPKRLTEELKRVRASVCQAAHDAWSQRLSVLRAKFWKPYTQLGFSVIAVIPGARVNDNEQRVVGMEHHDTIGIGRIIRCTRNGYKTADRIVRSADVIVSKGERHEGRD